MPSTSDLRSSTFCFAVVGVVVVKQSVVSSRSQREERELDGIFLAWHNLSFSAHDLSSSRARQTPWHQQVIYAGQVCVYGQVAHIHTRHYYCYQHYTTTTTATTMTATTCHLPTSTTTTTLSTSIESNQTLDVSCLVRACKYQCCAIHFRAEVASKEHMFGTPFKLATRPNKCYLCVQLRCK